MSTRRKWLIGLGAALLGTLLLIAAFSLGVFVGERGLTRGRLQPMGPQGGPPPQGQGQPAPPQNAQGGDRVPVLRGIVRRTSGDVITVETKEGPRMVQISSQTVVRLRDDGEREGSLEDVKPGMGVAVMGQMDADTRMLRADVVVVFPLPQRK